MRSNNDNGKDINDNGSRSDGIASEMKQIYRANVWGDKMRAAQKSRSPTWTLVQARKETVGIGLHQIGLASHQQHIRDNKPRSFKMQFSKSIISPILFAFLISNLFLQQCEGNGWIGVDERHSFSLSTFDPSGKLGQVEYAAEAAALGTPVVAIALPHQGVFLASPQVLPSPLIDDDGTARFARVTSNLLVAHSGLSADGRVLVEAAQQMAVQHEFAYDELIPADIFLEEMSLLFQEYTMKAGSRPFGVTLIVAHVPNNNDSLDTTTPMLYRIDPSGAVSSLGTYAVVNGNKLETDDELLRHLKDLASDSTTSSMSPDEIRIHLAGKLENALRRSVAPPGRKEHDNLVVKLPNNLRRILVASIYSGEGMVLDSVDLSKLK